MIKQFFCKEHSDKAISICASQTCPHRTICERSECQKLHLHNGYKMSHIFIEKIKSKREEVQNFKSDITKTINTLITTILKRFQVIENNYLNYDSRIRDLQLQQISIDILIEFMEFDSFKSNLKMMITDLTKKLDEEFKKIINTEQKKITSEVLAQSSKPIKVKKTDHKSEINKFDNEILKSETLSTKVSFMNRDQYFDFIETKSFISLINYTFEINFEEFLKESKIFSILQQKQTPEMFQIIKSNFNSMMSQKKLNINSKKCIYRASEFNFRSECYKKKLLDKNKTFFLILSKNPVTGDTLLLGAYLSKAWQNTFVYEKQITSFMFELTSGKIWNLKSSIYPILFSPSKDSQQLFGPVIGRFDLSISDRCDKNESFFSKNMSFNIEDYGPIIIDEYEVFQIKEQTK